MVGSLATDGSYTDTKLFGRTGRSATGDRRRNPRAPLHWTVYLAFSGSPHPHRTITRDINKDGFYCSLEQPVRPGERIECDIVMPTHGSPYPDDLAYLRCHALAVRVETIEGSSEFGLACLIEDYCVIRGASPGLRFRKDEDIVQRRPADSREATGR